jgi:hypothetical protein
VRETNAHAEGTAGELGAPFARLVEAFNALLATLLEYLRVRYAGAGERGARSVSRAISGGMPSRIGYP